MAELVPRLYVWASNHLELISLGIFERGEFYCLVLDFVKIVVNLPIAI
jgi:hypothetical protein